MLPGSPSSVLFSSCVCSSLSVCFLLIGLEEDESGNILLELILSNKLIY